ncbi:MAG: hypothetical protein Q9227_002185 [Pyrenula ochraceoflavens]
MFTSCAHGGVGSGDVTHWYHVQALFELGYQDVYHVVAATRENPPDCEMWIEAMDLKEKTGKTYGREQWDQLLGHCMAVTDMPCITFAPELFAAYPKAKVILTLRDSPDDVQKSLLETGHVYFSQWFGPPKNLFQRWVYGNIRSSADQPTIGMRMLHRWCEYTNFLEDWPKNGGQRYLEHNEMVRSMVPKDQLLEYNVKQGWGPLCEFLGKPVPLDPETGKEAPFPRANDRAYLQREFNKINRMRVSIAIVKGLLVVGLPVAVAWGTWRWYGKGRK